LVHRCSWPDGGGTHLDTGFQEVPARHFASGPKVRDALASFRASAGYLPQVEAATSEMAALGSHKGH
jgi:hypothetical protein